MTAAEVRGGRANEEERLEKMALRGKISESPLADVFRMVAAGGQSGVLKIASPRVSGSVWFRDGEVFFAQSDRASEPLGLRLVSMGRVTPEALEEALSVREHEPAGGPRLGEVLVAQGHITEPVLTQFVREQIEDRVFDLLQATDGEFSFEVLPVPAEFDIGLSVSMENLLMEAARRAEEARARLSAASDAVYRMSPAPARGAFDIALGPDEWRVLLRMDGTCTVAEAASSLRMDEADVARTVGGLLAAGVLEPAGETPTAEVAAPPEQPVAEREPDAEEAGEAPDAFARLRRPVGPSPEVLTIGSTLEVPKIETEQTPLVVPDDPEAAMRQLWTGLGDEVAAITGGDEDRVQPQGRPRGRSKGAPQVPHRDPSIDPALLERVATLIESL